MMRKNESLLKRVQRCAFSETTQSCLPRILHKRTIRTLVCFTSLMLFAFLQLYHLVVGGPQNTKSTKKIAWLMSYPNSGTSYTHVLVKELSDEFVATNYGAETHAVDKNGNSVLLYRNERNGPFLMNQYEYTMDIPRKFILTKTHCGGGCLACDKRVNKSNVEIFIDECRCGVRLDSNKERQVKYSDNIVVERTIHLIRNPIDNIVSRFHHEVNQRKRLNNTAVLPNTKEGFLSYCNEYDYRLRWRRQERYRCEDAKVAEMLQNVPCFMDFLCYVHWHNMAFATREELQIPWYDLHYEKYATHFNETAAELLEFLHLEEEGDPIEFVPKQSYSNFFSESQIESIKIAIKEVASEMTWEYLRHYFE